MIPIPGPPLPDPPALTDDVVQVWRIDLRDWEPWTAALRTVLSADEATRADRYVFERDRLRHVLCRGLLRSVLALHLDLPAAAVEFAVGAHGKPVLRPGTGGNALRFNVSHSGDWLFVALALQREVGVDVEQVRMEVDIAAIAGHCFTPAETASMRRLDAAAQAGRFFDCWVRKEAALKAWGVGLSLELQRVDVSADGPATRPIAAPAGIDACDRVWSLRDLEPPPGYRAALVVEGRGWQPDTVDGRPGRGRPGHA